MLESSMSLFTTICSAMLLGMGLVFERQMLGCNSVLFFVAYRVYQDDSLAFAFRVSAIAISCQC